MRVSFHTGQSIIRFRDDVDPGRPKSGRVELYRTIGDADAEPFHATIVGYPLPEAAATQT
jgi:hypothetical protein